MFCKSLVVCILGKGLCEHDLYKCWHLHKNSTCNYLSKQISWSHGFSHNFTHLHIMLRVGYLLINLRELY